MCVHHSPFRLLRTAPIDWLERAEPGALHRAPRVLRLVHDGVNLRVVLRAAHKLSVACSHQHNTLHCESSLKQMGPLLCE